MGYVYAYVALEAPMSRDEIQLVRFGPSSPDVGRVPLFVQQFPVPSTASPNILYTLS